VKKTKKNEPKNEPKLIEKGFHPRTGDPVWYFKDNPDLEPFLKDNGINIISGVFMKEYPIDMTHISVIEVTEGKEMVIECEKADIPELLQFLYNRTDAMIYFIGADPHSKEYVIGMEMKQPMKFGKYYYGENTLLLEKEFVYREAVMTLEEVLKAILGC